MSSAKIYSYGYNHSKGRKEYKADLMNETHQCYIKSQNISVSLLLRYKSKSINSTPMYK